MRQRSGYYYSRLRAKDQRRERAREGMSHISMLLTAAGLTTVHDAGASRGKLVAYQDTYQAGELRHRA